MMHYACHYPWPRNRGNYTNFIRAKSDTEEKYAQTWQFSFTALGCMWHSLEGQQQGTDSED